MTPISRDDWVAAQSPSVQKEISAFIRKAADHSEEFLSDLAKLAPVLTRGQLPILYELWLSVPSPLAFEIGVRFVKPKELAGFVELAANALLEKKDADEFADAREADDPLEEHLCWLRGHAYSRKLSTLLPG